MAYTYREAIKTAYRYLNIDENKIVAIEGTNGRGIIYNFDGHETVIFIYPISCKQNNKQNFFDTRDSGAKERRIAWEYAKEHELRYFCLGFNEEQERYKEYVFSLESNESAISNVSFRKAADSEATGTQVNIPNDFIPRDKFERIKTPKGFYIAAVKKEFVRDYIRLFDNRPYMKDNKIGYIEKEDQEEINKRLFEYWMSLQRKTASDSGAGELYSELTISQYVTDINKTMLPMNPDRTVFYTSDSDDVKITIETLQNSPNKYAPQITAVKKYLEYLISEKKNDNNEEISFISGFESHFKRNRILFGAPGTGKSFKLNKERKELLGESNETDYERVTFHPDYSYANFVGTYKPVMVKNKSIWEADEDKKEVITILKDKTKSAQEKYDLLYDRFKADGLTRLPVLLGLYCDENFKTRKQDGTDAVGDNSVERNHGRAIRPYVNLDAESASKKEIAYEYVPGPFMRVLVKALKSCIDGSNKPYLLVVEEINRANVAAVFGDVFQLLDRDGNSISEYSIATTNDMRTYLADQLGVDEIAVETIKIPDNMFIWATMNSADQGVFPMDTAFKRRWDYTYLGIDDAVKEFSEKIINRKYVLGKKKYARIVSWNALRIAINETLSSDTFNINEDKLLGPYFIAKSILESDNDNDFIDAFKNKVLMYLFDDAVKQKRKTFFEECSSVRYSEICKLFDEKGVFIFPAEISKHFTVVVDEPKTEEYTE